VPGELLQPAAAAMTMPVAAAMLPRRNLPAMTLPAFCANVRYHRSVESLTVPRRAVQVRSHKTGMTGCSICHMVTYLQISDDVAGRVASGALPAGEALPGVREAARRYGTTTTTVARAYRSLAAAGVIEVADRRRARVAAGGGAAATRMLSGAGGRRAALRLGGSDDPALDIVLRTAGSGQVVTVGAAASTA